MIYLIICPVAFLTSCLTLFSGFGLGTLLMPVLALFFPVDLAVALTAVVHLLNNLFKLALLGKHTDRSVLLRFGLPALAAAFLGAAVLLWVSHQPSWFQYSWGGRIFLITPLKLVMAFLIMGFALFEVLPQFQNLAVPKRYQPIGGLLSGFVGGLSGHQGALRTVFLIRSGLSKESFIGTGVAIACLIDVSRLSIYMSYMSARAVGENLPLLGAATFSAFLGAWVGNRWLRKVTMRTIQILVCALLFVIAAGLGTGLI